jgi:hypothetical protein
MFDERTRKSQRQQTNGRAAQQQQHDVFEAIPPSKAWRCRLLKHQRAEHLSLARGSPNQVEYDRERDGKRAGKE